MRVLFSYDTRIDRVRSSVVMTSIRICTDYKYAPVVGTTQSINPLSNTPLRSGPGPHHVHTHALPTPSVHPWSR